MSRFPMDRSRVREVVLVRQDRNRPACEAKMHVHSERTRIIHTLQGPVRLIVKLLQCRNKECDWVRLPCPRGELAVFRGNWSTC